MTKLWNWLRGPFIRRAFWQGFRAGKLGAPSEMNPWTEGLRARAWEYGRQEGDVAR